MTTQKCKFEILTLQDNEYDHNKIKKFIDPELSESYSIFTYYHFFLSFP